jgi:hypothetical protein
VHIGTLLLGGISPLADEDFLYVGKFMGEAGRLLQATGISPGGKSAEAVLSEFQRAGYFLAHVMECPLEAEEGAAFSFASTFVARISAVSARVRRSLKPKRIVLISELLTPVLSELTSAKLGCPVVLDGVKPFEVNISDLSEGAHHLRQALAAGISGK